MKVGSGGLQSLINQELNPVRKIENLQNKREEGSLLDPGINKPIVKSDELIKAVEAMNKTMDMANRNLTFKMHEETNRILVRVQDKETGEIVREYPPEKFLDMVARLKETVGVFVDKYI